MPCSIKRIENWVFWFGITGVLLFISAAVFGGLLMEGYDHTRQLISESYAQGTEYGPFLRWAGFIPSGICIAVFSFLAPRFLPKSKPMPIGFWIIGGFYGIGTVLVALFPCDTGCNPEFIDPSISQLIHTIIGGLTYITVPVGLVLVGLGSSAKMRNISMTCGIMASVFVMFLFADPSGLYLGIYQRAAEGCVLVWILFVSFYVKNSQAL